MKVLQVSQKSKRLGSQWSTKKCDAPGSWYCPGNYPPALSKLIARRKNFAQLEDFNAKGSEEDKK